MDLRMLLKDLLPPAFVRVVRNYRHGLASGNIWEGIYSCYRDVPGQGEGYHDTTLAARTYEHTEKLLAAAHQEGPLPRFAGEMHALLALVASLVCRRQGRVRVLDFGGGMGVGFIHLLSSLRSRADIHYHVVETGVMCDGGRRLFAGDHRIRFYTELPQDPGELDIVYVSSALQYVEDYARLLGALCRYSAPYALFTNLAAGSIPTYATVQRNLRGMRLPHWFLNVTELVELMEARGYSVMFASLADREYDQRNFPPAYRMRRACNLLFTQVDPSARASC